jgi:DNA-directed RNA polymerase subunit K/omega
MSSKKSSDTSTSKTPSSEKKKTQAPNLVKETRIEIDNNQYDFLKNYDPTKNLSPPYISKYELTSIIGTRALMISKGAPPLIEVPEGVDNTIEIAEMEINSGKCPIIVVRELFDGSKEYFKMKDLIIME